jgi:hypothetical protein
MYAKIEVPSYLPELATVVTEASCTVGDLYAPISHRFWTRARNAADKLVPRLDVATARV